MKCWRRRTKETAVKLFENKQVRTVWNEEDEKWYFSIMDIIEILTGTDRPRKYLNDLKSKLKKEVSELFQKIGQLKSICYFYIYENTISVKGDRRAILWRILIY